MQRWIWLASALFGLVSVAGGEEYELHLRTMESIEQPGANNAPEETTIRQLDVLVKPNEPFRLKMRDGKATTTFSGELKPFNDKNFKEQFIIEMKYRYEFDSGVRVVVAENRTEPLPDVTGFNSSLGLNVNKPVVAAEMTTKNDQLPGKQKVRNHRFVLVLKKSNRIAARRITKKSKA